MSKRIVQTVLTNLKINGREYSVKPEMTEEGLLRVTATGIEKGLKTVYRKDYTFKEIRKQLKPMKKYDNMEAVYLDLLEFLENNGLKLTNRGDTIDLVMDEEKVVCLSLDKIYSSYMDDIKKIKEENARLRAEMKKLKMSMRELQDEYESKIEELEDIIKDKESTIQELGDELGEYKKINEGLISRSKKLERQLADKDQKINDLNAELEDYKEMAHNFQEGESDLSSLRKKYEEMMKELEKYKKKVKELNKIKIKSPSKSPSKTISKNPSQDVIRRLKTTNPNQLRRIKSSEAMLAGERKKKRPDIHVSGKEILKVSSVFESYEEIVMLEKRLGIKPLKLQLLYKGTRDSDSAVVFHEFVRGEKKTISVVKTTNGRRFGGYTAETWDGTNIFKEDPKAFIFSFNKLKYYNLNENGIAIWCYPKYGPIFGGYQIDIFDHYLTKDINKTGPKGKEYKTTEDYELNDGNENFLVQELEVYKIEE